jgi:hypothetical protein
VLETILAGEVGVPVAIALVSAVSGFCLRGGTAREHKVLLRENHKLKSVLAQIMVDKTHPGNVR